MNLYALKDLYLGKDMQNEMTVGYLVANSDTDVFNHIDKQQYGCWAGEIEEGMDEYELADIEAAKLRMIENKGDFEEECDGEFYDVKHAWELKVADIDFKAILTLEHLHIIPPVIFVTDGVGRNTLGGICTYHPNSFGSGTEPREDECVYCGRQVWSRAMWELTNGVVCDACVSIVEVEYVGSA